MYKRSPIEVRTTNSWISKVLEETLTGRLVIPSFQRDYCWTMDNVKDLVDSLRDRIPIGSITVLDGTWIKYDIAYKPLMVDSLEARKLQYDHLDWLPKPSYVLDGAQRVQTLWKLFVTGEYRLTYNFMSEEYEVYHADDMPVLTSHADVSYLSSMYVLGSYRRVAKKHILPQDKEYINKMMRDHGIHNYMEMSEQELSHFRNNAWDDFFLAPKEVLECMKLIDDVNRLDNSISVLYDERYRPSTSKKRLKEVEKLLPEKLARQNELKSNLRDKVSDDAGSILIAEKAIASRTKIQSLEQAVSQYSFGVSVIETRDAPLKDIVKAFKRMNMSGVPVPIEFLESIEE